MVGFALERLGADPTVVNGGIIVNWEDDRRVGNVRIGRSGPWVVEADESDRSLLLFRPTWAVVTNVSADHFGLEESRRLFERFVGVPGSARSGPRIWLRRTGRCGRRCG